MSKKKSNNNLNLILTKLIIDVFEKSENTPLNYKQVAAKLNLSDAETRFDLQGNNRQICLVSCGDHL